MLFSALRPCFSNFQFRKKRSHKIKKKKRRNGLTAVQLTVASSPITEAAQAIMCSKKDIKGLLIEHYVNPMYWWYLSWQQKKPGYPILATMNLRYFSKTMEP
jgi:hypothetical protein